MEAYREEWERQVSQLEWGRPGDPVTGSKGPAAIRLAGERGARA